MTAQAILNEAISASAGSGKTFQLAHRYIKLLAHGVDPDRVVALTFSRKAAGEIFDSIVRQLCKAASSVEEAKRTAEQIGNLFTQDDFLRLLRTFLVSLHRLHIGTLDSFTIGIIRAFPLELGMPSTFQMLDSDGALARQVSQEVLSALFNRHDSDTAIRAEFQSAFKEATYGQEEKSLERSLERFTGEYRAYYQRMPGSRLWGQEDVIWPDGSPWLEPTGDVKAAAAELTASLAGSSFSDRLVDSFKKVIAFAGGYSESSPWDTRVTDGAVFRYLMEHWRDIERGVLTLRYSSKDYPVTSRQCALIMQLLRQVMGTELRSTLKKTSGIYRILDRYEKDYDAMIRRQGRLTFTDAQYLLTTANQYSGGALLSRTQGVDGRLYIDYRLDCKLDHWLLDEFQDTSDLQWEVLRNLVDEILQDTTGQRSFFYVGDVKQAIYGWRGGNAQLFSRILERYCGRITEKPLSVSYRSCQPVIDSVNRVFADLSDTGLPGQTIAAWQKVWQMHECSSEAVPEHGYVALLEPDCKNGAIKPEKEDRYHIVADLLQEIDPLSRELSTAVLVRSNEDGDDIADYLRSVCSTMTIINEGRASIKDNPVIAVLLALVKFAAHPGDTLVWRHIQMSPLHEYIENTDLSRNSLPPELLREIQSSGFQTFIRTWGNRLDDIHSLDSYGWKKLNDLINAAGEFDSNGSRGCNDFLNFIDSYETHEITSENAVRVMTVHQAKGLGFDIVILPDLMGNKSMTGAGDSPFLTASDQSDQPLWVLKTPRRTAAQYDPALAPWLQADDDRACFDELCVLYVALTRAKQGLYLITSYPGKAAETLNPAALLKRQLAGSAKPTEGRRFTINGEEYVCLYQTGERDWYARVPVKAQPAPPAFAGLPERFEQPDQRRRPVSIIPSAMEEGEISAGTLFSATYKDSRDLGTAIHQLFEKVLWADAFDSAKCVQGWRETTSTPPEIQGKAVEQFLRALESAEVIQALSRPEENNEVWREKPFEVIVDGQWITGTFDRVVIVRDGNGKALRATIIDFKSNEVASDSELSAAADRYRPQLSLYRKALSRILRLDASRIDLRLVFTQSGKVHPL